MSSDHGHRPDRHTQARPGREPGSCGCPRRDRRRLLGALAGALAAVALVGCTPDLEVRGVLERVVGEKLVLELLQGEPVFSGETRLVDSGRRAFDSKAGELPTTRIGERQLELQIPNGVSVGPAHLEIAQSGSSSRYRVELALSRLAVATASDGRSELLGLPGSSAGVRAELPAPDGGQPATASLSPDSGTLVVLGGDTLQVYRMGHPPRKLFDPWRIDGATSVAATPTGAIVSTDSRLVVLHFGSSAITEEAIFAISRIAGLAVATNGQRAAAVNACDTDNDTRPDSDCLTVIELAGSASRIGAEVVIDDEPGATLVEMRADGTAAVVADEQYIYGVLLDGDTPELVNRLSWSGGEAARPVGIDRTGSEFGDIFAVADATRRIVQIVGFDERTLKPVGTEIPLGDTAPAGLGFGRLADLYVAIGPGLVHINPYHDAPIATPVAVTASDEIVGLAVQR